MKKLLYSLPHNFCALGQEYSAYETSRVAILLVPYDSTAFYKAGSREGPRAIVRASMNMETFDNELEIEPYKVGIHTLDEVEPSRKSPLDMIERVEGIIDELLQDGKFPVLLGGEHSISLAPIRSFKKRYKKLGVLHLDAHADLRDRFEGSRYSHACVMRRAREIADVTHVGIRSLSREEFVYAKRAKARMFSTDYIANASVKKIINSLNKNVYVSIDLDVFDPSIMPAVGTPEPGGLLWNDVIGLLQQVFYKKNVVGFDVVELCPIAGEAAPDFLASKLAYKLIGYKFRNEIH